MEGVREENDDASSTNNITTISDNIERGGKEKNDTTSTKTKETPKKDHQEWSNPIEFLLSCIAMSVGLGNIWRFPMVAFENGGGAFLIPYLIVLTFVGRPMYFMELGIGQFASAGPVKIWKSCPAFKGVGWGQLIGTTLIVTYYCSLMGLSIFYFIQSFQEELPWAICKESFADMKSCVSSGAADIINQTENYNGTLISSAEFYFYNYVLQQPDSIDNGLGTIDWRLSICLFVSWLFVFLTLSFGVQSSGKVAYFTALFPYGVLFTLLIRGVTLPGSEDGILFFIEPKWEKLLEVDVWYNAVTQSFFSLSVSYGAIPMFASHNKFSHNVYRDAWIISLADTFTSLLAGFTIFSVIGNLKYTTGAKDISEVVSGGPGLAFVSYPAAIATFEWAPQLFAVLFFLMLFTLGLGSASALAGMVKKVLVEQFPKIPELLMTGMVCTAGFCIGLVYVTPSGMIVLDLVDAYGGNMLMFLIAILEVIGIMYCYGMFNFCRDMDFMLEKKLGIYWKISWGFIIPVGLTTILMYVFVTFKSPTYTSGLPNKVKHDYPDGAIIAGWIIFSFAVVVMLLNFCRSVYNSEGKNLSEKIINSFQPHRKWGPADPETKQDWLSYAFNIRYKNTWKENNPTLGKVFKSRDTMTLPKFYDNESYI